MFYREFVKIMAMKNALYKKLARQEKEDVPIKIHEILILPPCNKYGEAPETPEQIIKPSNMVERLIAQIKLMAGIANLQHQKNYCLKQNDGSFKLAEKAQNTITRLSSVEFSYYGERPLTLTEFTQIIEGILQVGQTCYDNVHVLFSSFSVQNEKNEILNIAVYLQGGEEAKVHIITKAFSHSSDVGYGKCATFSQRDLGDFMAFESSEYTAGDKLSGLSTICNDGLLTVNTAGGKKFLLALEICYDHYVRHTRRLLINQFDTSQDFPVLADHIITSNTTDLNNEAMISIVALHADPSTVDFANISRHMNAEKLLDKNNALTVAELNQAFAGMQFTGSEGNLLIKTPPFAGELHLLIYNERQLRGYNQLISSRFFTAHQGCINDKIDTIMRSNGYEYNTKDRECFLRINNKKIGQARQFLHDSINRIQHACISSKQVMPWRRQLAIILRNNRKMLNDHIAQSQPEDDFLTWAKEWVGMLEQDLVTLVADYGSNQETQTLLNSIRGFEQNLDKHLNQPFKL